jgi:hypothetical protein
MDADYLALEDLLVARLRSEMPELKAVLTAEDLAGVRGATQFDAAAHVVYLGDDVTTASGSGAAQPVAQQWMVVLVVKFAGTPTTGKGLRKKAGPLIAKLLQTVCGWQPQPAPLTALRRINAPKVGYDNGFAYYPFAFKTTHVTLGKS